MATKAPATTVATPEVEPLVGAARDAALALVAAGETVFAHLTEGTLAHLNTTLTDIVKLQPMLNRQLTACQGVHGDDVGPGRFHSWMTTLVASIGDKKVTWRLDANTTFLAASFKRDGKAWASYRQHVISGRRTPDFKRFVSYQERFKLGHYDAMGELTDAGKRFEKAQAAKTMKKLTKRLDKYEEMDWSAFFDADDTSEDLLVKYGELAYFFTSRAITLENSLKKTESGKATIAAANDRVRATIEVKV